MFVITLILIDVIIIGVIFYFDTTVRKKIDTIYNQNLFEYKSFTDLIVDAPFSFMRREKTL